MTTVAAATKHTLQSIARRWPQLNEEIRTHEALRTELTSGHRLDRGGHRQAKAALYRAVIVRMQHHEPTRAYVLRRPLEGKTKAEISRCLKRLLARETWARLQPLRSAPRTASAAA